MSTMCPLHYSKAAKERLSTIPGTAEWIAKYKNKIIKKASVLSAQTRNNLDDSIFGLPEERKFPMPDKAHVVKAWQFLNKSKLSTEQKAEVRKRIFQRAKALGVDTSNWGMNKTAQDDCDFDANKKIPAIEKAFTDPVAKKVAYMIATSHEYKKPNVKAALAFVKNYSWEVSSCPTHALQGINKPIIPEKVQDMIKSMNGKAPKPLITVNQLHGIRPQTPGKRIMVDGHHRFEACKERGDTEIPIYKGTYTGGAEKSFDELKEKTAREAINMSGIQDYKEAIYKQAGVIGGAALGWLGGGLAGMGMGSLIANMKHPQTPEVKDLRNKINTQRKINEELRAPFSNATNYNNWAEIRDYLDANGVDDMTVGQLKKEIYNRFNKKYRESAMNKTASLKSTLISAGVTGIPIGIFAGKEVYKSQKANNSDTQGHQKSLDRLLEEEGTLKKHIKSGQLPQYLLDDYGPDEFVPNVETDGFGWIHDHLSRYMKQHGRDINTMKMKDYKDLAQAYDLGLSGDPDFDSFDSGKSPEHHIMNFRRHKAEIERRKIADEVEKRIKANNSKLAEYKEGIYKQATKPKSKFQKLKDNKVPLTPEERKECLDRKAVWHFNGGGPSPAVWKSVNPKTGEVTYVTNTHRAYQSRPTLRGAISIFHSFIKGTA